MTVPPFRSSARVYDLLYEGAGKDYEREADEIHALVQARRPGAASLLDVGCGTGMHLHHLRRSYEVAGVDVEPSMLEQARRRLPDVPLTHGDMRSFRLARTFDAVICLFSPIGYMRSTSDLDRAVRNMAGHLAPRGVLVADGWLLPDAWRAPGMVHAVAGNGDALAVARVGVSGRDGDRTTLEMHHLIGTLDGVEHVVEVHELTLFRDDEYRHAFEAAGLVVEVVAGPMRDRDRYVGVRPAVS